MKISCLAGSIPFASCLMQNIVGGMTCHGHSIHCSVAIEVCIRVSKNNQMTSNEHR